MKWLLIVPAGAENEISGLERFLLDQHIETSQLVWDVNKITVFRRRLFENLEGVTHCAALQCADLWKDHEILFALGYLIGKGVPLYITAGDCPDVFFSVRAGVRTCPSGSDLFAAVRADILHLLEEENRNKAAGALIADGIPFTPDAFSFHVATGNKKICSLFLTAGMDANVCDSAGTPMLAAAARADKLDMVVWLLDHGADVDAVSKDRGYTAVMDAVRKSNVKCVELLIGAGADLNCSSKDGQTALVLAVGGGNEKLCRLLAENGADPLIKDMMGMSAYDYAKLFRKQPLCDFFAEIIGNENSAEK